MAMANQSPARSEWVIPTRAITSPERDTGLDASNNSDKPARGPSSQHSSALVSWEHSHDPSVNTSARAVRG
jgi:hypothetical protein